MLASSRRDAARVRVADVRRRARTGRTSPRRGPRTASTAATLSGSSGWRIPIRHGRPGVGSPAAKRSPPAATWTLRGAGEPQERDRLVHRPALDDPRRCRGGRRAGGDGRRSSRRTGRGPRRRGSPSRARPGSRRRARSVPTATRLASLSGRYRLNRRSTSWNQATARSRASGSTNGGRTSIVTVVPITGSTRSIRSAAPPVTGASASPAVPPEPVNLGRAQPWKPAASSAACSDCA